MTGWELPRSVTVAGRPYDCHTDYRDILGLLPWLEPAPGPEAPNREEGWYVALALFYPISAGWRPRSGRRQPKRWRTFWPAARRNRQSPARG